MPFQKGDSYLSKNVSPMKTIKLKINRMLSTINELTTAFVFTLSHQFDHNSFFPTIPVKMLIINVYAAPTAIINTPKNQAEKIVSIACSAPDAEEIKAITIAELIKRNLIGFSRSVVNINQI